MKNIYIIIYQMANVHGFRDMNNDNGRDGGNEGAYENIDDGRRGEIPFMMSMKVDRPVMDETIPYTLRIICCPDIRILSVTTFYIFAIWVLYIICLIKGLTE